MWLLLRPKGFPRLRLSCCLLLDIDEHEFFYLLQHLDGRDLVIRHPPGNVIEPGSTKMVPDEGMPRYRSPFEKGELYVKFDVTFPSNHFADEPTIKVILSQVCPSCRIWLSNVNFCPKRVSKQLSKFLVTVQDFLTKFRDSHLVERFSLYKIVYLENLPKISPTYLTSSAPETLHPGLNFPNSFANLCWPCKIF